MPWPGRGDRFAQRLSAAAGLGCAVLYGLFLGVLEEHHLKGTFGIPALVLELVASSSRSVTGGPSTSSGRASPTR